MWLYQGKIVHYINVLRIYESFHACEQHRAESVVPGRMADMIEAVRRKDFTAFAELTMKDSNQFHATCLDTYPPIFYLSSVSQQVIRMVHHYNRYYGETRVGNSMLLFLKKKKRYCSFFCFL